MEDTTTQNTRNDWPLCADPIMCTGCHIVECENGAAAHFPTQTAAETWAEWGHACTTRHHFYSPEGAE